MEKTMEGREKVKHLEESLRDCTTKCDNNPSKENLPTSRIRPVVRLHHTRGYCSLSCNLARAG